VAATLTELISAIRSITRDDPGNIVDDTDIRGYVNEAITDLGARLELFDKTITGVTATNTIALPPTPATDPAMVEPLHLILGASDEVQWVDDETWDVWSSSGDTPARTLGRIFAGVAELYPTPAVGTAFTLRYKRLPTLLDSGQDLHELPLQLERKLVEYGKFQALMALGRQDEASTWLALYESGLLPPDTGRRKSMPLPLAIEIESGPFDTDIEVMHR